MTPAPATTNRGRPNRGPDLGEWLERLPDGTLLLDEAGRVIGANAAARRQLGCKSHEYLGKMVESLLLRAGGDSAFSFPPPDTATADHRALRATMRGPGGERADCEVATAALRPPVGGVHWILTVRDITRRAFEESRQRESIKMAALSELAARVANDFNNQLAAVSANLEALWQAAQSDDRPDPQHLVAAREATRRAARVVRRLSAVATPSPSTRRVLDPCILIEQAIAAIQPDLDPRVAVRSDFAHGDWSVRADRDQLGDILYNCFRNALEAMPTGGLLTVSTHRSVAPELGSAPAEQPHEYVRIDVADTGRGIAHQHLSRIFDPFFTTKGAAQGLGLATVYGVLSQHEGGVTVESTLGVGTVMHIFLPRAQDAVDEPPGAAEPAEPAGSQTILLVDDESTVRQPTRRALEHCGYEVLEAADGLEGLERYRADRSRVQLAVLDVVMPRMSGWELLEALRKEDPQLPVVFVSGYPWTGQAPSDDMPVADAFLQKPYELAELVGTVRRLLGQRRQRASGNGGG